MPTVQTGTLVGYDAETGIELFRHINRPTHSREGASCLPVAHDTVVADQIRYRVIGVRKSSTESLWEIDVERDASS